MEWQLEKLEDRALLSVTTPVITFSGGIVYGTGTSGADTAQVGVSGGNVVVTIDNLTQSYPQGQVKEVNLSMLGGADSVTIAAGAPSVVANGGAGNDTIVASNSQTDTLMGGAGADSIQGGSTACWMNGGAGPDTLIGGTANDTIHGNTGHDSIIAMQGDSVVDGPGTDTLITLT